MKATRVAGDDRTDAGIGNIVSFLTVLYTISRVAVFRMPSTMAKLYCNKLHGVISRPRHKPQALNPKPLTLTPKTLNPDPKP